MKLLLSLKDVLKSRIIAPLTSATAKIGVFRKGWDTYFSQSNYKSKLLSGVVIKSIALVTMYLSFFWILMLKCEEYLIHILNSFKQ